MVCVTKEWGHQLRHDTRRLGVEMGSLLENTSLPLESIGAAYFDS
jgi:hypothetical protein